MTSNKPAYLSICISICSLLAHLIAAIHFCFINAGLLKTPSYLKITLARKYKTLCTIWHTRIVRRMVSALVRSPLRNSTLRLVNFNIPLPANSGCIILICHTPWERLLVQCCLENDFALIIAYGKWTHKRGGKLQREGKGFNELRGIIKYLKQDGRIIMTADNFNQLNNCPVKFLGNYLNGELLPTRLARVAQVPLIVAIPVLEMETLILFMRQNLTIKYYTFILAVKFRIFFLLWKMKLNPSISIYLINKFYKQE